MEQKEVYSLIEQHFRKHFKEQVKRLTGTVDGYHNAEDVVQESYARACQYWRTYDPALSFDAWLSGIRTNCVRDAKKDSKLRGLVKDDLKAVPPSAQPDASDRVLVRQIAQKIDDIKHPQGEVLKLYFVGGYTSKEVAAIVPGQTAVNVRQIVSRFRQEHLVT